MSTSLRRHATTMPLRRYFACSLKSSVTSSDIDIVVFHYLELLVYIYAWFVEFSQTDQELEGEWLLDQFF